MFVEVSPQLAAERGLEHLGWATLVTSRSAIEARVHGDRPDAPAAGAASGPCTRSGCPTTGATPALVTGDAANDLFGVVLDPNVLIQECKVTTCDVRPGAVRTGRELLALVRATAAGRDHRRDRHHGGHDRTGPGRPHLEAARDPEEFRWLSSIARTARWTDPPATPATLDHPPRKGFFTDTSVCIGCKACEVACKEWNGVPDDGFDLLGMSYDNTGGAGRVDLAARRLHRAAGAPRATPAGAAGSARCRALPGRAESVSRHAVVRPARRRARRRGARRSSAG